MKRRPRSRHACSTRSEHASRQPRRAAVRSWEDPHECGEPELGVELSDLEDLRPAVRAGALDRGATVLHRDLHWVLDLDLLAFLDAVALRHSRTSFREPIPRLTLDHAPDVRGPGIAPSVQLRTE